MGRIDGKSAHNIRIGSQRHIEHPVYGKKQKYEIYAKPYDFYVFFHWVSPFPTFGEPDKIAR